MAIWKETSADFPSGDNLGTTTEGQELLLGADPSLPGNWTLRGDLTGPPSLSGHLMVYDSTIDRHILFGGSTGGRLRNETWSYDASGDRWAMREPQDAPSPRNGSAMVFLPIEGALILFGGNDGTDRNDTWGYYPDRELWYMLAALENSPAPRNGHAMAFDTGKRYAVLFGGRYSSGPGEDEPLADTWMLDSSGDDWSDVTASGAPLPRYGHAMAFDPVNGLVVMFGGRNESDYFPDTWTFNTTTRSWTNRNPPTYPPARSGHSLAYDAGSGTVLLFGGEDATRSYNDTWAYNVSANTWTRKLLASGPSARSEQAMTFDPGIDRVVLFGGKDSAGDSQDDTWWYDPASNNWDQKSRPAPPLPRVHHAMVYSSLERQTLLFGGTDTVAQFNDTWLLNSSQNLWTRVQAPEAPSPRHDHAMAYDSLSGKAVLFGGLAGNEYVNDTWTYNFTLGTWKREMPPDAPRPGAGYLLAFDSYVGRMVMYGGRNDTDFFDETWTYDTELAVWTNLSSSPSPPPRDDGMMAYDSTRLRMVLFGGSGPTGALTDTWTYFSVSNTWALMSPATSPPGRTDGAMTFDTVSRRVALFGGLAGLPGLNDTWAYSILDDEWTELSPERSPPARYGHDMVFDGSAGQMVLFGGMSGRYCRAQTWVLGLEGRNTLGTYISQPNATGGSAYFGNLQFESFAPAGTSLRLQLRTAMAQADLEDAEYLGPDGTPSSYYTVTGSRVASVHNGTGFVQYCATLESRDLLETPRLKSVTLNYNLLHALRLISPAGGENWTGPRDIGWEVVDPDGDQILVDLYLLDGTGSTPIALGIPAGEGTFSWDTTEAPNGTYRIRAVARDENAAIPLSTEAVSSEFVLEHPPGGPPPPPENHPPVLLLTYPVDGSVVNTLSPRIIWNATDPDGDVLTYRVLLEAVLFDAAFPPEPYCVTSAHYLDVVNLTNGQTYYWSIIAGDGRDNTTTEVWHFTVKLGLVNLPPQISSTPPTNASVGVEYSYQIWATDPEYDKMTYSLTRAVLGMVINASSGLMTWTPRANQTGVFTVTVNVTDGRLGYDSQTFNITVLGPPRQPASVSILHPTEGWRVRGNLRITGLAANGTGTVVNVQVRIDGKEWLLANGTISWSYELDTQHLPNGRHSVEARCFDGSGYSAVSAVSFHLINPEPEPTLAKSQWSYVILGLGALGGLVLFWDLRRHPDGPPPMS